VEQVQEAQQLHWLEEHWRKARVGPRCGWSTLYIREGQAVCWEVMSWWEAAASTAEALDEIALGLQITWERRL
jgi:hypothetical protein